MRRGPVFVRCPTRQYNEIAERIHAFQERARASRIKIPKVSARDRIKEALAQPTPVTVRILADIVQNPKHDKLTRAKAADVLLRIGYGDPENVGR